MLLKKLLVVSLTLFFAVSNSASAQQDFAKSKVPLPFMENKGQIIDQNNHTNTSVLYQLALPGLNVSLKKDGFSYDTWMAEDLGEDQDLKDHRAMGDGPVPHKYNYKFHRVDVSFIGANPQCQIEALDRTPDYTMYYTTGTPEEGAKVHQYGKVLYRNLYHNIDLEFVAAPGTNKPVEYNFIVHPGADVAQIKMRYTGALDAALKNGALVLQLAHTELTESIPASWIAETKQAVQVNYKQLTQDQQSITIGFTANNINSNNTLIIDPTPNLDWGTYYGGSGGDEGLGIATDASGNILVTGNTASSTAIATSGAHQTTYGGVNYDAFVVKFNPSGTRLWGTYYGGSDEDRGYGIATDASGNVLVTGLTASSNAIATSGAHQTTLGGFWDAFVVKFSPSGTRLWGTYYGGSSFEFGYYGIATDASGNILVTGYTASSNAIATSGAHQTTNGGAGVAFVVKFNPSGTRLWGTYYGGSGDVAGIAIATDASGNILVTGVTGSSTAIATSGAHQTTYGGGEYDAFVVKFNPSGTRLWGTYYGGSGSDEGFGIAIDASGNILVTGRTQSSTAIATSGAHQTTYGGGEYDAFVVKFNPSGTRLWGTYYGGDLYNEGWGIATDASGNILVTGLTESSNAIATSGAHQTTCGGGSDAFVVEFNPSGTRLWGTYYGGSDEDWGYGIATDTSGNILVTGRTRSTNAIATSGAHQITYGGDYWDAFVVKFSDNNGATSSSIQNLSSGTLSTLIYPNPTNNNINVVINAIGETQTTIRITDLLGRVLLNETEELIGGNNTITYNISDYAAGVYLIHVGNGNTQQVFKVVKE